MLQEYGYEMQELGLRSTKLIIQLFKNLNGTIIVHDDLFNFVSCILQKLKKTQLSIKLRVHKEFYQDFQIITCNNKPLQKLFNCFCSIIAKDNDNYCYIHNFKLHQIELNCIVTQKKELNVCFTKALKKKKASVYC